MAVLSRSDLGILSFLANSDFVAISREYLYAKLYTVLLAAGLAFSSCSDQFLQDMNPYDSYSPEKTFGIESNLDLYSGVAGAVPVHSLMLVLQTGQSVLT